eukprot:TRINITY_DN19969_c0_g1_i1.p1 TRINITY_DN19969_c0_g1~~TRINITY_DN19969_c0_g1_i1.p1  ORF type:complete len:807 (+),score=264.55 TRINITY_DN19969_c0_g1_i1:39-2423(+)
MAVAATMAAAEDSVTAELESRLPPLVPAESEHVRVLRPDAVALLYFPKIGAPEMRPCGVVLTSFQLIVVPMDRTRQIICVPLMAIDDPLPEMRPIDRSLDEDWRGGFQCEIRCKLPWIFRLAFKQRLEREATGVQNVLRKLRETYTVKLQQMFAFEHKELYVKTYGEDIEDGWNLYDVEADLQRQIGPPAPAGEDEWAGKGVGKNLRPWYRIAQLEKATEGQWGGVSPTYPLRFVVPREATDKLLLDVAKYRSRARIPVISYVLLQTGASLSRASQPLTGARGASCTADEILLESLLANDYPPGGTPIASAWRDSESPTSPALTQTRDKPSMPPPLSGTQRSGSPMLRPPPSLSGARPPPSLSGGPSPALRPKASDYLPPAQKRNRLCIFDARSSLAAQANKGRGGGFEDVRNNYKSASIVFLNMDNVHGVVKSWKALQKLVEDHNNNLSNRHRWPDDRMCKDLVPGDRANDHFFAGLDSTKWLQHVQRMLWGAIRVCDEMFLGNSCLVHCSDGWDRTSQLSATAMLCLDRHYRSIRGFALLVEREWCTAGHKFAERCGHQVDGTTQRSKAGTGNELDDVHEDDEKERKDDGGIAKHTKHGSKMEVSPIFMQWLDGVWQIIRQFPRHFEFTAELLEFLADNLYSCRFGTFMCNFDKERDAEKLKQNTVSIWTEVLRLTALEKRGALPQRFVNPLYNETAEPQTIRPSCNAKRLALWESLYLRYDTEGSDLVPATFGHPAMLLREIANWKRRAEEAEAQLRGLSVAAAEPAAAAAPSPAPAAHADPCEDAAAPPS